MENEITNHGPAWLRSDHDPAAFALAFVNTYDPMRTITDLLANPEYCRVFLSEWCEMDWDLDWGKIARRLQLFRDDLRSTLIRFMSGELALNDFTLYLDHKLMHWPWIARPVADGQSFRVAFVPSPHLKPWRITVRALARYVLFGAALAVTILVARFDALSVLLGFSIVVVGIMGEALYSTYRSFTE